VLPLVLIIVNECMDFDDEISYILVSTIEILSKYSLMCVDVQHHDNMYVYYDSHDGIECKMHCI
jgi:hypothetical protein